MSQFHRNRTDLIQLFEAKKKEDDFVKICAPMVRFPIVIAESQNEFNSLMCRCGTPS
jgi:hypothetical protein